MIEAPMIAPTTSVFLYSKSVIVLLNSFAVFQVNYGDVAVTSLGVPSAGVIISHVESFRKSFADLDRIRGYPALYTANLEDQVVHTNLA